MTIEWLGHASFLLSFAAARIITDPYEPGSYEGAVGYRRIEIEPDIVTVSHSHADHNYVQGFSSSPLVFDRAGEYEAKGVRIKALASFHDASGGRERGSNLIFIFEAEGLKIVHLGDLGTVDIDYGALRQTSVLLVPVGGTYTLGARQAKEVCERISPRLIIPMHFKTEKLGFPIAGVEDFAGQFDKAGYNGSRREVTSASLPSEPQVLILKPSH